MGTENEQTPPDNLPDEVKDIVNNPEIQAAFKAGQRPELKEAMKAGQAAAKAAGDAIRATAPVLEKVQETEKKRKAFFKRWKPVLDLYARANEKNVLPFFKKELEKPEYGGQSADDLFNAILFDENGGQLHDIEAIKKREPYILFLQALENAEKERKKATAKENLKRRNPYAIIEKVNIPKDKLASTFFLPTAPTFDNNGGKLTNVEWQPLNYGKDDKHVIPLYYRYSYNEKLFNQTGIEPKFTGFEYFLGMILHGLYDAGEKETSLTHLYHLLFRNAAPDSGNISMLSKSLIMGSETTIEIDAAKVYEEFHVDGAKTNHIRRRIFPISYDTLENKGEIIDGTIKIYDTSPFMEVAGAIGQRSNIWISSLNYKGKKTRRYFDILLFMAQRVVTARNPKNRMKNKNKIEYETLYKNEAADTKEKRRRTKEMLFRVLDSMKDSGIITNYCEYPDISDAAQKTAAKGIIFHLSRDFLTTADK